MAFKWFLMDLGNTVIRLQYDRVIQSLCTLSSHTPEEMRRHMEAPGGYRDMERGTITFWEFYEGLCERAGYSGSIKDFHDTWSDFFSGPVEGMEELLKRLRERYRIAYLSNSNEVHAEVIPEQYAYLFAPQDVFIFSHVYGVAKPDHAMFRRALGVIETPRDEVVFVDDVEENVEAARQFGIQSYLFRNAAQLARELELDGLL